MSVTPRPRAQSEALVGKFYTLVDGVALQTIETLIFLHINRRQNFCFIEIHNLIEGNSTMVMLRGIRMLRIPMIAAAIAVMLLGVAMRN